MNKCLADNWMCLLQLIDASLVNTARETMEQQKCRSDRLCTALSRWILVVTWYNITAVHSHNKNTSVCIVRHILCGLKT